MKEEDKKNDDYYAPVRDHTYDGIKEYDQRLPGWWLWTLYITIIFSVAYWFYAYTTNDMTTAEEGLNTALKEIESIKLEQAGDYSNDNTLWKMSLKDDFVNAGKLTYATTCAACHGPKLEGGIGQKLSDKVWVHGNKPTEIFTVIEKGVLEKGMPPWGATLGTKKIAEVTAYILTFHQDDNPAK